YLGFWQLIPTNKSVMAAKQSAWLNKHASSSAPKIRDRWRRWRRRTVKADSLSKQMQPPKGQEILLPALAIKASPTWLKKWSRIFRHISRIGKREASTTLSNNGFARL